MALPPEEEIVPVEIAENEELLVFRIVRSADIDAPDYHDSFKSHAELGIPPRGSEQSHPLFYEGISVYETAAAAIATAQKFPRIGGYIAEMRVSVESGARYFRWGAYGHLTLWGDALKLSLTTVDIVAVSGEEGL